jgi:hypothetical protein
VHYGATLLQVANPGTGEVGEDIFGPFEAGFGAQQDNNLLRLGCTTPSDGYIDGGADTQTFEKVLKQGACTPLMASV